MAYNILLMGASYGSLLASKLLFGGHSIHLVCLPAEADLINAEGFKVTLPVRGRKDPVLLESRKLPGKVTAGPATGVDPSAEMLARASARIMLLVVSSSSFDWPLNLKA